MMRPLLAGAALALGLAAWLTDRGPGPAQAESGLRLDDAVQLVRPLDLARSLRDRDARLRIADARPDLDATDLRVPRAVPLDLPAILRNDSLEQRWVLYDEGGGEAVAGWRVLDAAGFDAAVLAGGFDGWAQDVLEPVLPWNAPDSIADAFEAVADLSRYFGGVPRVAAPGDTTSATWARAVRDTAAARPAPRRRGGCGWN